MNKKIKKVFFLKMYSLIQAKLFMSQSCCLCHIFLAVVKGVGGTDVTCGLSKP